MSLYDIHIFTVNTLKPEAVPICHIPYGVVFEIFILNYDFYGTIL